MAKRKRTYRRRSRKKQAESGIEFILGTALVGFIVYKFGIQELTTRKDELLLYIQIGFLFLLLLFTLYVAYRLFTLYLDKDKSLKKRKQIMDRFNSSTQDNYHWMDGHRFEEYVADVYRKLGYKASVTQRSGDNGVDVVLEKEGKTYALQSKRYKKSNKVTPHEVRDFIGSCLPFSGGGIFVTTSDFTKQAYEEVENHPFITLVNGEQFRELDSNI